MPPCARYHTQEHLKAFPYARKGTRQCNLPLVAAVGSGCIHEHHIDVQHWCSMGHAPVQQHEGAKYEVAAHPVWSTSTSFLMSSLTSVVCMSSCLTRGLLHPTTPATPRIRCRAYRDCGNPTSSSPTPTSGLPLPSSRDHLVDEREPRPAPPACACWRSRKVSVIASQSAGRPPEAAKKGGRRTAGPRSGPLTRRIQHEAAPGY